MSENNGKVGKGLFFGFLGGAIIGSITALLYAPKKGEELRGEIKEKSNKLMTDAETYAKEAGQKASELAEESKEKASSLLKETEKKVTDLKDKAADWLGQRKERLSHEVEARIIEAHKKQKEGASKSEKQDEEA